MLSFHHLLHRTVPPVLSLLEKLALIAQISLSILRLALLGHGLPIACGNNTLSRNGGTPSRTTGLESTSLPFVLTARK